MHSKRKISLWFCFGIQITGKIAPKVAGLWTNDFEANIWGGGCRSADYFLPPPSGGVQAFFLPRRKWSIFDLAPLTPESRGKKVILPSHNEKPHSSAESKGKKNIPLPPPPIKINLIPESKFKNFSLYLSLPFSENLTPESKGKNYSFSPSLNKNEPPILLKRPCSGVKRLTIHSSTSPNKKAKTAFLTQ